MDKTIAINLIYVVLAILVFFSNDILKLRKKISKKYNERILKAAQQKKSLFAQDLLSRELYILGYKENNQLREDVTSIYESIYTRGEYFRLGDDGSVSSRCVTVDFVGIAECLKCVSEFVTAWHNGHIVRSDTLHDCRILAQCENIVLIGKKYYDCSFEFTIWRFDEKTFSSGKKIDGNYNAAKVAFATEIVLTNKPSFVDSCEKITDMVELLYVAEEPLTDRHEIRDIIPPKWSAYVESSYLLL